jgi:hypothetical protein
MRASLIGLLFGQAAGQLVNVRGNQLRALMKYLTALRGRHARPFLERLLGRVDGLAYVIAVALRHRVHHAA